MTEKKLYICEYCRTPYSNEKDCIKCEMGHKPAKRVKEQKYVSLGMDHTGYPTYVFLTMADGTVKQFRRC